MKVGDLVRKKRSGYFPGYSKAQERGEKPDIGVVVEVKRTHITSGIHEVNGIVVVSWPGWGTFATPSHTLEVVSDGG